MELETLTYLASAIVLGHVFHSLGEARSVKKKAERLVDALAGKGLPKLAFEIQTLTGSLATGLGSTAVASVIIFLLYLLADPGMTAALWFTLVAIVILELLTITTLDRFHRIMDSKITKKD